MSELVDILRDLPEGSSYRSDYTWKSVSGNHLAKATGTPGPVAKRVLNFMRRH